MKKTAPLCRRTLAALLLVSALTAGCTENGKSTEQNSTNDSTEYDSNMTSQDHTAEDNTTAEDPAPETEETMKITIGDETFTVQLEQNETAAALTDKLPLTLDMSELNGNEKYYYLPFTLPTDSKVPDKIEAGDIMLYGDDCLVVFYKSFTTQYSYTKIGHIVDDADLSSAVGKSSVQMTFSLD